MVDTSLSTPRPWGLVGAAGSTEEEKKRENHPVFGEGVGGRGSDGVWSTEEESQLLSLLARGASAVAPGKTGREELDFSHAARVV